MVSGWPCCEGLDNPFVHAGLVAGWELEYWDNWDFWDNHVPRELETGSDLQIEK